MNKIESFKTDHTQLKEGLYVARTDRFADAYFTTFDLRFVKPNTDGILSAACMHAIEHLGATFFRNDPEYGAKTVYFGPMGCRTGFYLILHGQYASEDVRALVLNMLGYILSYEGTVPGASEKECGNFKDISLKEAQNAAGKYAQIIKFAGKERFIYPA